MHMRTAELRRVITRRTTCAPAVEQRAVTLCFDIYILQTVVMKRVVLAFFGLSLQENRREYNRRVREVVELSWIDDA